MSLELAYLAGLFDGEGCIGFYRHGDRPTYPQYILTISVVQSYRPSLESLSELFGGFVHTRKLRDKKPHHKQTYQWYVRGKATDKFLEVMTPYLREKKAQAELALEIRAKQRIGPRHRPTPELLISWSDEMKRLKRE